MVDRHTIESEEQRVNITSIPADSAVADLADLLTDCLPEDGTVDFTDEQLRALGRLADRLRRHLG